MKELCQPQAIKHMGTGLSNGLVTQNGIFAEAIFSTYLGSLYLKYISKIIRYSKFKVD